MANSADPNQLASEEANWSGSTPFAKAGHIWVQQDQGKNHPQVHSIQMTSLQILNYPQECQLFYIL